MSNPVPVNEARKHLGTLIDEAYHGGIPAIISKGKTTKAVLIGSKEFIQILGLIEKHYPNITDTLAILSDNDIQSLLAEDDENIKKGKLIHIK